MFQTTNQTLIYTSPPFNPVSSPRLRLWRIRPGAADLHLSDPVDPGPVDGSTRGAGENGKILPIDG